VRQIRTLRSMWRGLETGLRRSLNGHEAGNGGYGQGGAFGVPRQSSTLPVRGAPGDRHPYRDSLGQTGSDTLRLMAAPIVFKRVTLRAVLRESTRWSSGSSRCPTTRS
jgi:hypothetical protein